LATQPKWREEWDQLTLDPATGQPFKYLDIKGWYDWQEKFYTTDYIRDYFGKDEDPDYGSPEVRVVTRWMMDWLRRQRGRMRHTLPNDPSMLLHRMNMGHSDSAQAPLNLLSLVSQDFLVPTNECVRDRKYGKESKEKEIKVKILPSKSMTGAQHEDSSQELPTPASVEEPKAPVHPSSGGSGIELASTLWHLLDEPKEFARCNWPTLLIPLLAEYPADQIASVMKHAIKEDDFSAEYLTIAKNPMASFIKNYPRLLRGWKALQKGAAAAANRQAKLKPATAPSGHKNDSGMEF
jgi:hypothetical protein